MKNRIKSFMVKHSKKSTMLVGVLFATKACILVGFYEPEIDSEILES